MYILQIEHPVHSFEGWKRVFDSDPVGRKKMGVRRYRILRDASVPNFVVIELEFAEKHEAEALLAALGDVWRKVEGKLIEGARHHITEVVETVELGD